MLVGVERLPGAPGLHRWADWAELLALASAGGSLSVPELRETFERRRDFIASESQDDQDPSETEEEPLIKDAELTPSEFRDALSKRAGDILNYLIDRSDRYGLSYPFEIDRNQRVITLRDMTDSRRLYLLILICAALRYVTPSMRIILTGKFELLCVEALRRTLPSQSEVHLFGKSPLVTTGRYAGLLIEKIKLLANDLGEDCSIRESDFEPGDNGDNGLDIVAWIPFSDNLPGRLAIFGQAACTPEWISKQHSSSAAAWRSTIRFTADPQNVVFIPYDYRRPEGGWYTRRHIHGSIVFDRHRLMTALTNGSDTVGNLDLDEGVLGQMSLGDLDAVIQQDRADL